MLPGYSLLRMFPLIGSVIIHADNIQISHIPAEFGVSAAGNHVPGLELGIALIGGGLSEIGAASRNNDVENRIDMADTGAAIDFPEGLNSGKRGSHEIAFEFLISALGKGIKI